MGLLIALGVPALAALAWLGLDRLRRSVIWRGNEYVRGLSGRRHYEERNTDVR